MTGATAGFVGNDRMSMRAGSKEEPLAEGQACRRMHLAVADAEAVPLFADALSVWSAKRGDRPAPRKADISAHDFQPRTLPHLLIVDVQGTPPRFVFRLTGTMIDRIHNRNLTGVDVDDLSPPAFRETLHVDFRALVDRCAPQFVELVFPNRDGVQRDYRVLRLPLLGDEDTVAHILIVADHGADPDVAEAPGGLRL